MAVPENNKNTAPYNTAEESNTAESANVAEAIENGIYYREWRLSDPTILAKGVVLLVHGICEHCQRYDALARARFFF